MKKIKLKWDYIDKESWCDAGQSDLKMLTRVSSSE